MSNEYHLNATRDGVAAEFGRLRTPIRWADAPSDRPLAEPIKPTTRALILRPADPADPMAGLDGLDIRWWMVPLHHKGAVQEWRNVCTNARIEMVDTSPTFRDAYQRRRCLVPLTSFIEYSEPPGWKKGQPKTRHEIAWQGADTRYFAGVWERSTPSDMPQGFESFAFVTGPCCPDVAPICDDSPAILTLEQGMQWLDLQGPGKAAFADPPPAGTYEVRLAPREAQIMSREMRRALP
jgi:putative SOS response-associated peptidase YedK